MTYLENNNSFETIEDYDVFEHLKKEILKKKLKIRPLQPFFHSFAGILLFFGPTVSSRCFGLFFHKNSQIIIYLF